MLTTLIPIKKFSGRQHFFIYIQLPFQLILDKVDENMANNKCVLTSALVILFNLWQLSTKPDLSYNVTTSFDWAPCQYNLEPEPVHVEQFCFSAHVFNMLNWHHFYACMAYIKLAIPFGSIARSVISGIYSWTLACINMQIFPKNIIALNIYQSSI